MDPELRQRLIGDIIEQLQEGKRPQHLGRDIDNIYVHFFTKRGRDITACLTLAKALDCLYNDVYLFEDFDLREADRIELHTH